MGGGALTPRSVPQTSVLCKSAVHAGAVSDNQGGRVAVDRGRSLTLYESAFANGILSKMCVWDGTAWGWWGGQVVFAV